MFVGLMGLIFLLLIGALIWVAVGALVIIHRLTHPTRLTYGVAVARDWPTSPSDLLDAQNKPRSFTEATATLPDGHTTPVWLIDGDKPNGPVVVVTHGWSHSRFASNLWINQLAPFASKLIAYDMRGHGESSAAQSRLGTVEVDDLLNITRQFASGVTSATSIILAGQSMGGGVSIAAAGKVFDENLTDELPVNGVLVDGVYRLGMQPVEGYFKQKGLPLWPFWLPVAGHLSFWYTRARLFDRATHAAKLRCPLLALHGELDEVCPVDAARQIVDAANGAGNWTRLVTFPDAGHLDSSEVNPQRYRDALASFFDQVARRHENGDANAGSAADATSKSISKSTSTSTSKPHAQDHA